MATLIAAIVGEAASDHQLRQFKVDPANRNSVCDIGLWRWSRHPNYFFEGLCWLAYPMIAIDLAGINPYGWLAALAPACMYWVLVYVSGIPHSKSTCYVRAARLSAHISGALERSSRFL